MNVPQSILFLAQFIKLYIVGGAVRDWVMGVAPKDWDLASDCSPDAMMGFLIRNGLTVIPTGIEHGTITVLIDNVGYEITTFRGDHNCDGRHAQVEYVSTIEEDLARRDFTINAMAYCPISHSLIDPYNGQADITAGIIRCVGDASSRFKEDYLRVVRALRFAAKYNYTIEPSTWKALVEAVPFVVANVSIERISQEFEKTLGFTSRFVGLLRISGLLNHILPELAALESVDHKTDTYHYGEDALTHTLDCLANMEANGLQSVSMMWGTLMHDIGKLSTSNGKGSFHNHEHVGFPIASRICKKMKLSMDVREFVCFITRYHGRIHTMKNPSAKNAHKLFSAIGRKGLDQFCHLLNFCEKIDNIGGRHYPQAAAWFGLYDQWKEFPIGGKDLIELGYTPGPQFSELLGKASILWMQGKDKAAILHSLKPKS